MGMCNQKNCISLFGRFSIIPSKRCGLLTTLPTQEIMPTLLAYKNWRYFGLLVESIVNLQFLGGLRLFMKRAVISSGVWCTRPVDLSKEGSTLIKRKDGPSFPISS